MKERGHRPPAGEPLKPHDFSKLSNKPAPEALPETGLVAQISITIELIGLDVSYATVKYGDTITYLCKGDKITFTIPYVTKISDHQHVKGHSEQLSGVNGCKWVPYEYCPICGEKNNNEIF